MKRRYKSLLTIIVLLLYGSGCGQKIKEAREAMNNLENIKEAAENIQDNLEKAEEKLAEKREKGDTLAIHYEELAKFLPESLDGYDKSGDLDGGTTTMPGMGALSSVKQQYENEDGDRVSITLVDYNATYNMYMTVMAAFGAGFEIDTPEQRAMGFKISEEISGWQEYEKKSKDCKIIAGIADRFYVEIEAENQEDEEFVKSILTDVLPINELANY